MRIRDQGSGIGDCCSDYKITSESYLNTSNSTPRSPIPDLQSPLLVVPACEPGRGGGHLTRCMALVSGLRALNRDAYLYADRLIDGAHFDRNWFMGETGLSGMQWGCIVLDRFQTPAEELERWSKLAPVIGIDEGGVSRNCFDFLIDILPGCYRSAANIADVSLLPLPNKNEELAMRNEELSVAHSFRVLVSFGQEDAAGLGFAVTRALAESNDGSMEISLLQGGLGSKEETENIIIKYLKILLTIPDLVNHLTEYDLIITHYGITAFEALYMGVPVLLVSPGAYHEKLARKAGFYSLGVGKAAVKKLKRLFLKHHSPNFTTEEHGVVDMNSLRETPCPPWLTSHSFLHRLKDRCAALATKHNLDHTPRQSLAELINGITPDVSRNCPACGAALHGPALARYAERTYCRCTHCGIIAMNRLTPPPIAYGKEYFFELYQKQYGKTYIEDFPNLTAMAKRRLAVIKSLRNFTTNNNKPHGVAVFLHLSQHVVGLIKSTICDQRRACSASPAAAEPTRTTGSVRNKGSCGLCGSWLNNSRVSSPRLLDIGCAYGPFLAAAREEGFSPCGIDPAEDAVRYVTETLGIPAVQGFFPEVGSREWGVGSGEYDVVSLWYVIEHFRNCVPVLAEIRKRLKPGGVLAFATPSFMGISGRASLKGFLERSPADHWTIWSPAVAKKVLTTAGFTVKKIINSGHHPERFPVQGKFARSKKSPLYWLLLAISKIFSLGDTFEVYAVRKEIHTGEHGVKHEWKQNYSP